MNTSTKKGKGLGEYMPLAFAAGIGSMLGSGIIVGLSATIVVWQEGLGLDTTQVGLLSGILTFAIAFGSLFGGRLADKIGRVLFFNWINLFYAIGAAICVFAPNFTVLLIGPCQLLFSFSPQSFYIFQKNPTSCVPGPLFP